MNGHSDTTLTQLHRLSLGLMTMRCNWRTSQDIQGSLIAAYDAIGQAIESVERGSPR